MLKPSANFWMDGKIIPRQEAQISVLAHSLHYGDGIFEGIKIYRCIDGRSAIFRLGSHVHRLFFSALVEGIKIPFTKMEIEQAIIDTVKFNNLQEGYIRPLVIYGEGDMGPCPHNNPVHVIIIMGDWEKYFTKKAISVKISKWRRDNRVMPFSAKVTGNYVNAGLAKREAEALGFDDAIVLDRWGNISEASAANIFIVKDGNLMTPIAMQSLSSITLDPPILKGITRNSLIRLAHDIGISVEETPINQNLLYDADEFFQTGTAAEITPIKDVEEIPIGKICPGPITQKLQELFLRAVRGEVPVYQKEWLTYV